MKPLWFIVTGNPVPQAEARRGSFFQMFQAASREAYAGPWEVLDARDPEGLSRLPEPEQASGVIISGSPARLSDGTTWMRQLQSYLRQIVETRLPVLGVCFGHQLLGEALGGSVGPNPNGREMGTVELSVLTDDLLFSRKVRPFLVNMTHLDSVLKLPPQARVIARSELEPHAAVRFGEACWGVQFHPEIDREVLLDYVDARVDALLEEGLDPAGLASGADDALPGNQVLLRFLRMVNRSGTHL